MDKPNPTIDFYDTDGKKVDLDELIMRIKLVKATRKQK